MIVEFEEVYSGYGNTVVHKGISFKVESSQIVAIVGGSGAGKTTLLRLILGLLKPLKGEVRLFGKSIKNLSEEELQKLRDRMGVVFQFSALFGSMTVLENVMYPVIKKRKLDRSIVEMNACFKLSVCGLKPEDFYKYPQELSGGMKKKTALARALSLDPELLILDEPTSGLDPISAEEFDNLIKTVRDTFGTTVIMVTHDLPSLRICDKVLALREGKIVFDGKPQELFESEDPWIKELVKTSRGKCIL
ncbi:ABC transporter ATP-binding protein [Aquifex aeolicus]|uniref:ABC transporter n=1 Tax=Aquifex aeolicus (strain VF5) TaxID=224324 RepID=O67490_AQUAE|nr:ATP-binding cassette domain-containing protein [Aquifex aeolicus]AAC07448.1 ABC transporter [Aquifex aeolicus VF5]